jgi:hypothetical protein
MPTPNEILQSLALISNGQQLLAILWHALLTALILALLLGWRPTQRLGAMGLALPLLSVSVLAGLHRNPFNGAIFLLAAVGLAVIGFRRPSDRIEQAPAWASAIGAAMVAFGWIYPHFLESASWAKYLYRAPTGLIPCPTLSLVLGFALLAKGFSSRPWSIVLAILGIFYSLFGAFRLGVVINIGLLIGTVALLALIRTRSQLSI